MITITADYGYDVHSIRVEPGIFEDFSRGEIVTVDGQGFIYDEDGWQQDHWLFDGKAKEIRFWLDNGAEFFAKIVHVERDV